jgi:hypothetical protein
MRRVVKCTHELGKKFLVRTFMQRGAVTFEVDLDNVKASV